MTTHMDPNLVDACARAAYAAGNRSTDDPVDWDEYDSNPLIRHYCEAEARAVLLEAEQVLVHAAATRIIAQLDRVIREINHV